MKKLLVLSLMLGSASFAVPTIQAAAPTAVAPAEPQIREYRQMRRGRPRVTTFTRITRVGRTRFRETVRVTHLPNGRTRTQVIRRVRIGRAW